jgi:S1-C subfamily serine protease
MFLGRAFVVVVLGMVACGRHTGAPKSAENASGSESAPSAQPKTTPDGKQIIPDGTRVPSPKLVDRRSKNAMAPDTLGLVKGKSIAPKTSTEIYKSVAPATVIIRAGGGLGSGVIVDPAGWILTNHHVIEQGEKDEFRMKVNVVLGKLSTTTGGMQRLDATYEAYVHKADKLRDIALIKLVNPPKNLAYVRMAKDNPVPGQHVVALGHAGAGMLWALKAGEISALGKLSEQLATLAQFKGNDPATKQAEETFKKYLDERNLGLVIQSTCNILPGDSGGPLLTAGGELIGLNAFSNQDPRTGGLLSFHIHRSELATFLKQKPSKPARMLPDPWKDGGGDASYEDIDLDGRVDALVLEGRRACSFCPRQSVAVFLDVDQDSFKSATKLPPLTEVYKKQKFDAEIVYLQVEQDAYVWYDSDNDGKLDLLAYDPGATGRAKSGYQIKKDGDYQKDASLDNSRDLRASLLKDKGLHQRTLRIASAAFPSHYVESGAIGDALPDPVGHTGTGYPADLDRNGSPDALSIDSAFSSRLLLDLDGNSVSGLPSKLNLSTTTQKLDFEVGVVTQSTHMWVWYDTNDDGQFDLALHSPGARLYVAADAWHVDAQGNKTEAPEEVGRKLIRPDLVKSATLASALRTMVGKGLLPIMSAEGDAGIASFPEPIKDHRGTSFELLDIPGAQKSVVLIYGQGSDGYLIDLDQNSLRNAPAKPKDLEKRVTDPKFDAEFAYFQRNGLAWAYYDADGKKGYDVVLYSSDPRAGKVDRGFRVDSAGTVTLDTSLKGKPLVSPSLFKKASNRKRLGKLGKELFGKSAVE